MIETKAPVKKAIYKATRTDGKPNKNPRTNENFTSPKPIPLPFVTTNKNRKNNRAPRPAYRWFVSEICFSYKKAILPTIERITKRSGIIPYSISAKKIPIRHQRITARNIADKKVIVCVIKRPMTNTNVIPVRLSTIMSLFGIFFLQNLHFPLKIR